MEMEEQNVMTQNEELQKRNLTTVGELRSWAMEHASSIPDPMNGKTIQQARVGEVAKMPPEEYTRLFLGGDGNNAYYTFLNSQDEIAIVKISYEALDEDRQVNREDTVLAYRKGGEWYPLTGLQVIHTELQIVE